MMKNELRSTIEIPVHFSEVDMMKIMWHGHYIKYMEDGREDFGKNYGISYMEILAQGYMTPVVKVTCDFKKPLRYGDTAIVETRMLHSDAAKIIYSFNIYRSADHTLVATGESIQVFLDMESELVLTLPEFFQEWKRKWGFR